MSSNTAMHPDSTSPMRTLSRQSARRSPVAVWAACCLAILALGFFEIKGPIWFVILALTLVADVTLYVATHRVTDRPTSALDEREQTIRNRAYRSAYLAVFFGITVVVAGAMILYYTGHELASHWLSHSAGHPAFFTGLGVATLQLVSLLPTAIVTWTEGDEPEAD